MRRRRRRREKVAIGLLSLLPRAALADEAPPPCERTHKGVPFATCFDPGNRLHIDGSNLGASAGIALRHDAVTADKEVTYRLSHNLLFARGSAASIDGAVYRGRLLRHAREGTLTLPGDPPRAVPFPFDIGVDMTAFDARATLPLEQARITPVRLSPVLDPIRASTRRVHLGVGPLMRWDMLVDTQQKSVLGHRVVPFSGAHLGLHLESQDGLWLFRMTAEASVASRSDPLPKRQVAGTAEIERVLFAVNDAPVSLFAGGDLELPGAGARVYAGLRMAVLSRSRRSDVLDDRQ